MESNDYRLERWLAVLLSLLFFLPFVARADDILFANASYHGDEMPYRNGEEFLALKGDVLVPVRIQVRREHDPIVDNEGEVTGKHVGLPGFEDYTFLVRGKRLSPGRIAVASSDHFELQPVPNVKAAIHLGTSLSHVYYRCNAARCALVLETNGVTQDLVTIEKEMLTEVGHVINFAGDLDHDGRLDLIVNASTHWNETRPALFLSTPAKDGQLVARVAELPMTGC